MLLSSVVVNVARTTIFVAFVVSAFPFRSRLQPAPLKPPHRADKCFRNNRHVAGNERVYKKALPPAARIEQTVTVGAPITAVCCGRTRLQLRPFLHWCVCPKESMAPG